MKHRVFVLILAGALAGASVAATPFNHSWREFPQVSNSGFTEASGDRAMQLSIEVPASAHEVFQAFTTSEGFSSWAVPVAHVDFRIGGYIEASYDPAAKPGDPNNIRNRILAYVPDRVLVIKNEQAPKGFADPELFQRTSTVIEFAALSPTSTRVTLTNAGYGKGEGFDTLYQHFEWGNAYTLAELRSRFEKGPVDWQARAAQQKAQEASKKVQDKP
jgi:uncharacterized protein YndB with AHSA1/START domain